MAEDAHRTGTGRWLRVALLVSLAVNLAVAGMVAGAWLSHGNHHPGTRGAAGDVTFGRYSAALSEVDRTALRRAFRDRVREGGAPGAEAWRAAARLETGQLQAALRAEPFELSAVAEIFAAQRARLARGATLGQELLLDRIAAMGPEARAAFADRLGEGRPRTRE